MEMAYGTGALDLTCSLCQYIANWLPKSIYPTPELRGNFMYQESKIVHPHIQFLLRFLQALNNIELHIRPNEIFTIFGPARSGKTTLLKSLNRLTGPNLWIQNILGRFLLDGKISMIRNWPHPVEETRWNRF